MGIQEVTTERIRQSYSEGRLDYLIGAGASIDAGLPTWSTLNRRLLERFFRHDFSEERESTHLVVDPEPDELSALSTIFAERLGREPVIDLIKSSLDDEKQFRRLLRKSLYGDTGEIELKPLQYELASVLGNGSGPEPDQLVTTNYDDLLERAYCRLHGLDEHNLNDQVEIIATKQGLQKATDYPRFVHLHGYLPQGRKTPTQGTIVLSERDYLQTTDSWQTTFLSDEILLARDRDLLIVGMSMADPRLRRLLHDRAGQSDECGKVFVLLPKSTATGDDSLAVRRAHKLLRDYETRYWDELDVGVKFVANFDKLPLHLRRIRLGDKPDEWCSSARHYLHQQTTDDSGRSVLLRLYDELKQREAHQLLAPRLRRLRSQFEISHEEELTLGYFVPTPHDESYIQLAFRFNAHAPGDYLYEPSDGNRNSFQGVERQRGRRRLLRVESEATAQGAAGYAFTTGAEVEVLQSSEELNRNFDNDMMASWDDGRTFSALLCVPIYGSPLWLPLGVGFLSSNRRKPFWCSISESDTLELYRQIRTIFRELLEY